MKKEMKLLKQMHIHSMNLLQKIKILNVSICIDSLFMNHDIIHGIKPARMLLY